MTMDEFLKAVWPVFTLCLLTMLMVTWRRWTGRVCWRCKSAAIRVSKRRLFGIVPKYRCMRCGMAGVRLRK